LQTSCQEIAEIAKPMMNVTGARKKKITHMSIFIDINNPPKNIFVDNYKFTIDFCEKLCYNIYTTIKIMR
jgi:hypothetical protein